MRCFATGMPPSVAWLNAASMLSMPLMPAITARPGACMASGRRGSTSSPVAKHITASSPGWPASSTKPGLGTIQSGMRTVWLADTSDEGLVALGSRRIMPPCEACM